MVMSERVEVLFIRELSSQFHVCVKVIYGEQAVYIVNSYFKFSEDIGLLYSSGSSVSGNWGLRP